MKHVSARLIWLFCSLLLFTLSVAPAQAKDGLCEYACDVGGKLSTKIQIPNGCDQPADCQVLCVQDCTAQTATCNLDAQGYVAKCDLDPQLGFGNCEYECSDDPGNPIVDKQSKCVDDKSCGNTCVVQCRKRKTGAKCALLPAPTCEAIKYCWCMTNDGKCENHQKDNQGQLFGSLQDCNQFCTDNGGKRAVNFDDHGYINRAGSDGKCLQKAAPYCNTYELKVGNEAPVTVSPSSSGPCTKDQDCIDGCVKRCTQNNADPVDQAKCMNERCQAADIKCVGGIAKPAPKAPSQPGSSTKLYDPLGGVDIFTFSARIIRGIIGVVGALALGSFVYGAVLWILSHGDQGMIKKGRSIMVQTAIGGLIIFGAYTFIALFLSLFRPF